MDYEIVDNKSGREGTGNETSLAFDSIHPSLEQKEIMAFYIVRRTPRGRENRGFLRDFVGKKSLKFSKFGDGWEEYGLECDPGDMLCYVLMNPDVRIININEWRSNEKERNRRSE